MAQVTNPDGSLDVHDVDGHWASALRAEEGPIDVIDMFSGCGGMSAGFLSLNGIRPTFRLALAVDIDRVANRTYEHNLGLRPLEQDVHALATDPGSLEAALAGSRRRPRQPLVLIGCAPCQGFSSHRNSSGEADPRNSLFLDFARVAVALRPAAVVVENVPELLTYRYWPLVEEATALLRDAGYSTNLSVHNLAEFGVPQERFRALLLAMPHDFDAPVGFLGREQFRSVRDAIGGLPPVAAGAVNPQDPMHRSAGHAQGTIETIRAVPRNGGSRPHDAGPDCLRRVRDRQGRSAYDDVYGRLWWDRAAITITAYSRNPASGRYVHPEQDRGLSIREAALLQGFPDTYMFDGSLDDAFRQIGNAVPPVFATSLAGHVVAQLGRSQAPSPAVSSGITQPVGTSFARLIPGLKSGHLRIGPHGIEGRRPITA
jgi:DNA (cytosine-5)-methyltransferase 1